MQTAHASAPGKVILFGEHAVVYGRPAIAVPVTLVQAHATVTPATSGTLRLRALQIGLDDLPLDELPRQHPLRVAVRGVLDELGLDSAPAGLVTIESSIPVAAGLGSGAAVSAAVIRALALALGRPLPDERVSALTYEVEKLLHGTPSGIDNTVVTYARPVYFVRDKTIETFSVRKPFRLLIGDTGVASPTSAAVGDVRRAWQADPARYEALFDAAGRIADQARSLIESGRPLELGPLMNENQALLAKMGVSSPELERLIHAARAGGALGAKLSGGGRGGNMIALVDQTSVEGVRKSLVKAGAVRVVESVIKD